MRRKTLLVASVVFKTASAWFFFGIHQPCRYGAYLKTWIASTVMGRHVVGQTTYGLITLMCSLVYSRHNNATTIILINDNYTVLTSIKDDKHEPWAAPISITFTQRKQKKSPSSPIQMNDLRSENKVRLQKILKDRFKATVYLQQAELI